ncbi:ATP-binding protein [Pseudazoarcus pumilus]|uniref:histidine kinase n=1 Tax=Pseudazoarcus pumilus TaxID=2067960 RepID=A0A2I6S7H0_9RHOO|nr:HAMP domain-containing sensor histidine kinase [Pseudazoarcus pumilus]AUN95197.1 sensor histidine kinase [Pseudazoarcus pumilus]
MLRRLPYRVQIPLGLSLAVLIAAVLVTAVSAQVFSRSARAETLAQVDRAVALVIAQVRPMLVADDTWRVFSLLRDTAGLLPGAPLGHARLAVVDVDGRVFAASDPLRLETGRPLLGEAWHGAPLPREGVTRSWRASREDGSVLRLDPITSDDGQTLGYVLTEIDAAVFGADWPALAGNALAGIVLAVALLLPAGWWVGQRMTRPVERLAMLIGRIGREEPGKLRAQLPHTADPELARIGDAVAQLMDELERRREAEERALSAERLAAVGRMTAAVAHEINNPLAGLLTATRTLRLRGDANDVRERTVDLIDRGLQQIRSTVTALLPQVRVEERALDPDDLDDVLTLVQGTAERLDIRIERSLEVESALRVPSAPLRQVMLNMLLNALKAAGEHGRVETALHADAEFVEFSVANDGQPVDAERLRTLIAAEGGRDPQGFGLWVCQELASHLHGSFVPDPSAIDRTRLVFRVPNREDPASPS